MCYFSGDIVLCRSKAIPCTKSQLLSPSVFWTPVLSPPQVFWADWSTWELPCLFKNSRAQTPNYEYAEQHGRVAHLFHGLAGGQTFFFFFQQQEDRSFTLKAELMPRCKRQTAETDATLIKTFQQSTTGNLQGFILSIDLQLQTQPKKKKKKKRKIFETGPHCKRKKKRKKKKKYEIIHIRSSNITVVSNKLFFLK